MILKKLFKAVNIIIIITLFVSVPVFGQDRIDKNNIVILPLEGKDVPTYIPMIVERLFAAKIEKTDAYFIFDRKIFDKILLENEITLPKHITEDIALEIGKKLEINHILYGKITKPGDEFLIKTTVMDSTTGTVISEESEKAFDLRGLEVAVGKLTRSFIQTVLPEQYVAAAVESLDTAENTLKEENVQESIAEFEKIAEENPEQALEMVAEPVREAIKETVREEIVDEEIQNLYDQEKADKKKVWQFWTVIGLESVVQLGNIFGSASVDLRMDSNLYWNDYMNSIFINEPYRSYKETLEDSQGNQIANYLFTAGGNFGLAYMYKTVPADLLSFTDFGRKAFVISNMMQISGYITQTASAQLGFYAQRKYLEYNNATSDFADKYDAYRTAYLWPMISEYMSTGLFALGITGMVTAAILPGEKTPIILSDKSRKYLTWGQSLISIGNLTSGIGNNLRGSAEETWISDNSPSGTIGDSNYLSTYISSQIFYYSTYALYIGGAVLTWIGLNSDGLSSVKGDIAEDNVMNNISFGIIPVGNSLTAFARLRLD